MSALTNAGKIAFLKFLKESVLHLAFGTGSANWGTAATYPAVAPVNGEIVLPHQFVTALLVTNTTTGSTGTEGTPEDPEDYYVDHNGGVVYLQPTFAAENDNIEIKYNHGFQEENPEATALISEQVRKLCLYKEFVQIDNVNGEIVVDGVRYIEVSGPTNHLYVQLWLEPNEYANGIIREVGVFMGGTTQPDLPEGQLVFTPAQVVTPGTMILTANYATMVRNLATRTRFHFVISLPLI